MNCSALLWGGLNCWCTWPPVSTLLPRVETAQGWRIQWKAFLPRGVFLPGAQNTYGVTSLTISRTQTLPPPSALEPASSSRFSRFRSARPGEVIIDISPSKNMDVSVDGSSNGDNSEARSNRSTLRSDGSGLNKYKSDKLTPRPTRASSGNFGRVAAPLQTAASMQASALLTGAILPEREGHTTLAARQPSLLAIAPSGELYPAPAGSMPYDILPNAYSLGQGMSLTRRASLGGGLSRRGSQAPELSFDEQLQKAAEQAMGGSNARQPQPPALAPAVSMQRMPSALPFWMEPTIDEDASYHPSVRVSYSGPYGQASREEERAGAGDVIAAAAAKLLTVAEADESRYANKGDGSSSGSGASAAGTSRQGSMQPPKQDLDVATTATLFAGYGAFTTSNSEVTTTQVSKQGSMLAAGTDVSGIPNLFSGYGAFTNSSSGTGNNTQQGSKQASRRGSAMLRLAGSMGAAELAALTTLTGDFSALWDLAPVSNSPFILGDNPSQQPSPGSTALSSPRPPPPPSPFTEQPVEQVASPRTKKVSFQGASPFTQMDVPPAAKPIRSHSLPHNGEYRDQSIRLESFQDSFYINDSIILNEQTAMEAEFFSPFAAVAEESFDPEKLSSNTSRELGTPVQRQRSRPGGGHTALVTAPSASEFRVRAASRQLLDIAATLSPMASAALRTQSVLVVPVMPSSIYDHSIASKPSFEASPPAPRDYTYLVVTLALILGLVGCAFGEKYLQS